jgi:hypothetical protein
VAKKKHYLFDEGSPMGHTRFDHLHEIDEKELAAHGIEESVTRNNGGRSESFSEGSNADLAKEVESMTRSYGISAPEALLMLERAPRVETHGLSDAQLRESWKPYSNILTEVEIDGLVRGRVAAPRKG